MILAQIDIEPWHVYTGAAGGLCYAALRIWTAVRKQKMDERQQDSQTEFFTRVAKATEETARTNATMCERLQHVCKATCNQKQT